MLTTLRVSPEERQAIARLLTDVQRTYAAADQPAFLGDAGLIAHDLPHRLRTALHTFRTPQSAARPPRRSGAAALLIAGNEIDEHGIGPTPAHWRGKSRTEALRRTEFLLVLYSSLLGDVYGWATQQDGDLVHDILPIAGQEDAQLGSGSSTPLMWHTEEAFHPHRADYVGLLCLRNPDRVGTTVGTVDLTALAAEDVERAFEPRFYIRPDTSHLPEYNSSSDLERTRSFDRIRRMDADPDPIPILFGDRSDPFLRIDPAYMYTAPGDDKAEGTLHRVMACIEKSLVDVRLEPGMCCFIDNYRAVHGRARFRARYDGTDRWLKRVSITRDLRRSAGERMGPGSRLMA
ncbi:arginine beta-hydroxylase, Fe(II)/alpha-ketoglutarate-dependent [Sinosporangium album]|uniref:Arginine beta-hydroxylase, Fe(II)/alpha-ketoglutarate-dependent n=1 Tax=Sinosporangium album TaxID=504805 RepID=A0A1G7QIN8_9ACTN|nr:guanitoxin biosynthesis L-enduracididine beta-hydroxylase GntD [Sinosporangium album]SDF98383.1 arginine beta-hydroxylase, Fe(II)/alpha-ketoglutarate-dependent [Sinosporangium album]